MNDRQLPASRMPDRSLVMDGSGKEVIEDVGLDGERQVLRVESILRHRKRPPISEQVTPVVPVSIYRELPPEEEPPLPPPTGLGSALQ